MSDVRRSGLFLVLLFAFVPTPCIQAGSDIVCKTINVEIFTSKYLGVIDCLITQPIDDGWTMHIDFDKPAPKFETWNVELTVYNEQDVHIVLKNRPHHAELKPGDRLRVLFKSDYKGALPSSDVYLVPTTTATPPPPPQACTDPPTSYNYNEVLHKSILFYEAQRSGKLPVNNRIPWRGDSATSDSDGAIDLSGGWYDAGDHLKLNFPMAYSVTVLAWGFLEYKDAYEAAGEVDYFLDCIKWALDYMIKCHPSKNVYYYQVGGSGDHAYWGRSEDMTMERPVYKVTPENPGSEVTAESAAAMAAASMVFRHVDAAYADKLLEHAKQLYELANTYKGNYNTDYYSSTMYGDEIVWSQIWLYLATNNTVYLDSAILDYNTYSLNGGDYAFSWSSKKIGVKVLLCKELHTDTYCDTLKTFVDNWLPGNKIPYTPYGLAFRDEWGSLRYSAGTSLIALLAADLGLNTVQYRTFAKQQLHYMLGSTCRSYVIGFGVNPPTNPHHRSSSCSDSSCSWSTYRSSTSNAHILTGALIGGPDSNDTFLDERTDYIHSEVACDYNAAFQSAIAGLKHLELTNQL
ncbi:endoglucanase F-like [Glandiceps talaboti]